MLRKWMSMNRWGKKLSSWKVNSSSHMCVHTHVHSPFDGHVSSCVFDLWFYCERLFTSSVTPLSPIGLWGCNAPWFICWFWHYIFASLLNSLLTCLLSSLLIYFLKNRPIPFQATGRMRRPNLVVVFCVYFEL